MADDSRAHLLSRNGASASLWLPKAIPQRERLIKAIQDCGGRTEPVLQSATYALIDPVMDRAKQVEILAKIKEARMANAHKHPYAVTVSWIDDVYANIEMRNPDQYRIDAVGISESSKPPPPRSNARSPADTAAAVPPVKAPAAQSSTRARPASSGSESERPAPKRPRAAQTTLTAAASTSGAAAPAQESLARSGTSIEDTATPPVSDKGKGRAVEPEVVELDQTDSSSGEEVARQLGLTSPQRPPAAVNTDETGPAVSAAGQAVGGSAAFVRTARHGSHASSDSFTRDRMVDLEPVKLAGHRSGRVFYTFEDKIYLAKYLLLHDGLSATGRKVFEMLADRNQRHTMYSWQEHYKKNSAEIDALIARLRKGEDLSAVAQERKRLQLASAERTARASASLRPTHRSSQADDEALQRSAEAQRHQRQERLKREFRGSNGADPFETDSEEDAPRQAALEGAADARARAALGFVDPHATAAAKAHLAAHTTPTVVMVDAVTVSPPPQPLREEPIPPADVERRSPREQLGDSLLPSLSPEPQAQPHIPPIASTTAPVPADTVDTTPAMPVPSATPMPAAAVTKPQQSPSKIVRPAGPNTVRSAGDINASFETWLASSQSPSTLTVRDVFSAVGMPSLPDQAGRAPASAQATPARQTREAFAALPVMEATPEPRQQLSKENLEQHSQGTLEPIVLADKVIIRPKARLSSSADSSDDSNDERSQSGIAFLKQLGDLHAGFAFEPSQSQAGMVMQASVSLDELAGPEQDTSNPFDISKRLRSRQQSSAEPASPALLAVAQAAELASKPASTSSVASTRPKPRPAGPVVRAPTPQPAPARSSLEVPTETPAPLPGQARLFIRDPASKDESNSSLSSATAPGVEKNRQMLDTSPTEVKFVSAATAAGFSAGIEKITRWASTIQSRGAKQRRDNADEEINRALVILRRARKTESSNDMVQLFDQARDIGFTFVQVSDLLYTCSGKARPALQFIEHIHRVNAAGGTSDSRAASMKSRALSAAMWSHADDVVLVDSLPSISSGPTNKTKDGCQLRKQYLQSCGLFEQIDLTDQARLRKLKEVYARYNRARFPFDQVEPVIQTRQDATVMSACNVLNNGLQPGSYKFVSDCADGTEYCDPSSSTCRPRKCRRSEYPYGFSSDENAADLPPRCAAGTFCPDEGDGCLPLVPVGQACQLNRDDECAPPPANLGLLNQRNNAGVICLNFQCVYGNVTLGNSCILDNFVYTAYAADGTQTPYITSRDNCVSGLYCEASSRQCEVQLNRGSACSANKQCSSYVCGPQGVCLVPLDTAPSGSVAVAVIVALLVIVALGLIFSTAAVFGHRIRASRAKRDALFWSQRPQRHRASAHIGTAISHKNLALLPGMDVEAHSGLSVSHPLTWGAPALNDKHPETTSPKR
ncbi:hypothetical protein E5Q_04824 [Mixia osmundae IAM 14324]|uniref:BRCT domain-containing protein n=1 Tax=Mixia osmundae (strain CBS 9802 / IAM 14324 / JCM 22182 / KY 12970) TaxID=764103 RepID=G7E5N1_MIXOS|nr:hypothetical protein E5Q_04824 [Mixia osmundae IAM 14324]